MHSKRSNQLIAVKEVMKNSNKQAHALLESNEPFSACEEKDEPEHDSVMSEAERYAAMPDIPGAADFNEEDWMNEIDKIGATAYGGTSFANPPVEPEK